ncbi:MAG: NUDIX domain-containing protein [Candidatus Xiphinematobacter sp.]|nr:MAG: NUDIX domain-containing protein [Candidatus Xiphinematobacter sp.]QQY09698.1 MAG: NUDIX domain-containing protein [Candidatus Xiphinematobacter sp.]
MQYLYRANVALILENADGKVLIGERGDIAESWQFPQGGVRRGESLKEALYREVKEEIFLLPHHYRIYQSNGPYQYHFPKVRRQGEVVGQRQHYFRALLLSGRVPLKMRDTSDEFRSLRWISPNEFQLKWLHPMKWEVYTQVFQDFFSMKIS